MIQSVEQAVEVPPSASWLVYAAVAASVAAVAAGSLLSYALIAGPLDKDRLLWTNGPGELALVVAAVLLAGAVLGVVLGFIALALHDRRRLGAIVAVLLSVASLLAVGSATAYAGHDAWTSSPHPSDAQLIGTFDAHKAQFEQALAAFKADGRVEAKLLHSIGVRGAVYGEDGVVYMDASVYGLATGGSSKGFAYSASPLPTSPVGDLKNADTGQSERGVAYKHISGPWYLFYEWD